MTVVFFSNVLNHHQIALCDELYKQTGGSFWFVETNELNADRRAMGFKQYERPYLLSIKSGAENLREAMRLAIEADVAIMGAESHPFLKRRIKKSNGVTFSYSERWLKQGVKNYLSPNLLRQILLYAALGCRRKWYMLAASAYLANDLYKIGIFRNRVYKWGYFPDYKFYKPDGPRTEGKPRILWVGRFLDWKRPDMMIDLAEHLSCKGLPYEMTLIGDGPMAEALKTRVNANEAMSQSVRFTGNLPNDAVIKEMERSDIYCFTSNRREGWGAVLGEAMAARCIPVACVDAGATPFLLNKDNGYTFKDKDEFLRIVEALATGVQNGSADECVALNAPRTISGEWNAAVAAREFLSLAKNKLADPDYIPPQGTLPASPAFPVK